MSEPLHIVIGTPCFSGQLSSDYVTSLFQLQGAMAGMPGVKLTLGLVTGDALITRARANLVTGFLNDPTATHLLFIDADIGFESDQVLRLINSNLDMVAAIYPIKRIDWDRVRAGIQVNVQNIAAASLHYVVKIDNPHLVEHRGEFMKVQYAGAGFLMIRRHVLERMCARYPELQFTSDDRYDRSLEGSPNRFALFDCMIDAETGTYLSEDYAFCKRWLDMGGEIWADTKSKLRHVGPARFSGDFTTQL